MIPILLAWCLISSIHAAVLDPALYLVPSPPLSPTSDTLSAEERWVEPLEARMERDANLNVVPLEKTDDSTEQAEPEAADQPEEKDQPQPLEKAGFWPGRSNYGLGGIHIPLTFSISGSYGQYGADSGLIGSSYASAFSDGFSGIYGKYGKSGFAGSSYGSGPNNQGVRIYGSGGGPSWSGWGNGKWGHYGKG